MRFNNIKYKKYNFPLKAPLQISNQIITHKESIIISAEDEIGKTHYGEISPLVGFSKESISECEEELKKILKDSNHSQFIEINDLINKYVNYPSMVFGLEQIIFGTAFQNQSMDDFHLVSQNALVGIDTKEKTIERISRILDNGFSIIKLKIGRNKFSDDLELIKSLDNKFNERLKLRLDNNGSWSYSEAKINLEILSKFNIEYFEQPVKTSEDLLKIAETSSIPIAADESISDYHDAKALLANSNIKYFVIKPSLRIGLYNSIKLIEEAKKFGVKIIVSSAFETAIGRNSLIYLASLLENYSTHGLNTELLGGELIKTSLNYSVPKIKFSYSDLFSFSIKDFS